MSRSVCIASLTLLAVANLMGCQTDNADATVRTALATAIATTTCADFETWRDLDVDVPPCASIGPCTALITNAGDYSGTCSNYCGTIPVPGDGGRFHTCVAAHEETGNSCRIKYEGECDVEIPGTSDIICTCSDGPSSPTTSPTLNPTPPPNLPTPSPTLPPTPPVSITTCADESTWPHVGRVCGGLGACTVLMTNAHEQDTCSSYCQSIPGGNHICVGAYEEEGNACVIKSTEDCDRPYSVTTSDLICTCSNAPPSPTTSPTLNPTPSPTPPTPSPTLAPTVSPTPWVPPPSCSGAVANDVCNVPANQCARLSGPITCSGGVVVDGTLEIADGSTLSIGHDTELQIGSTGVLQVGFPGSPARNVEINLANGRLMSNGEVYIFGVPKTSWTLLAQPCDHCEEITVQECHEWEIGDTLVLVGNGNHAAGAEPPRWNANNANDDYRTEKMQIVSINQGCVIGLDQSSNQNHRKEWYNNRIPINSEVLNLDRSVRIVGNRFTTRQQGFNTVMKIHHTKLTNCGKAELAEYCLHFHHVGPCPACSFVGNAVSESINKALTVHGTSETLVEKNVLYNHKGAFMYIEDGNEIGNLIKDNAIICPTAPPEGESVPGHGEDGDGCAWQGELYPGQPASEWFGDHIESDFKEQAGIYVVSATNNFTGNHIAGMQNALFQDFQAGQAGKIWGDGNMCPQANPWGEVEGNYFHNNRGFGFYAPHSSYPTNVQVGDNGRVSDWNSCLSFAPSSGEDNSRGYEVWNHVELYHDFGVGGYNGGESTFRNLTVAFALKGVYYKTFRRGINSGPWCDGCYFYNVVTPDLPGGSLMWEMKDTVFEETRDAIYINHHCGFESEWTGGLCASHFWFSGDSRFDSMLFKNEQEGYSDSIVRLGDITYFSTPAAHPAFTTTDCTENDWDFTSCPSTHIRIVRIYSPNRGVMTVVNNDEENREFTVGYTPWTKSSAWGESGAPNSYNKKTDYVNGGMGYTFLVKANQSYTLHVGESQNSNPVLEDLFTLEYSDIQMPEDFISIAVESSSRIAGSACRIQSTHSRNWITPYGPYVPASGAWWGCHPWQVDKTVADYDSEQQTHFTSNNAAPFR